MLRIDYQRARSREAEPGADRGFSKSQRNNPVRRRKSPAAALVIAVAACELRKKMKLAAERAVEMTVAAKPCGFRTPLGNRFAIPTFPPPRRLLDSFNTKSRKELSSAISSGFLQAHSSIGKDYQGALPGPRHSSAKSCTPSGVDFPHSRNGTAHDLRLNVVFRRGRAGLGVTWHPRHSLVHCSFHLFGGLVLDMG